MKTIWNSKGHVILCIPSISKWHLGVEERNLTILVGFVIMSKFNNVPMWFCDLGFCGLDKIMLCIYSWKVMFMALGLAKHGKW